MDLLNDAGTFVTSQSERRDHALGVTLKTATLELDLKWKSHFIIAVEGFLNGNDLHGEVGEGDLPFWGIGCIEVRIHRRSKDSVFSIRIVDTTSTPPDERGMLRGLKMRYVILLIKKMIDGYFIILLWRVFTSFW
jgi:hypothetical protein